MRIALESLDGRNFELSLPREGSKAHVIALQNASGLRGIYLQEDARIALEGAKVDQLVGEVLWHLASGPLRVAGPLQAGAVAVDLLIPRGEGSKGPSGRVALASLTVPAFELTVGKAESPTVVRTKVACRELSAANPAEPDAWHVLATELEAERTSVQQQGLEVTCERLAAQAFGADFGADVTTGVRANTLVAAGLGVRTPSLALRVGQARLDGVRVALEREGLSLEAARVELRDVAIALPGERTVQCPGTIVLTGLRFTRGDLSCNKLEVEAIAADLRLSAAETEATAPERAQDGGKEATGLPDLSVLDRLQGSVHADLTVDVKIPFLSRRVATHKMRLDVRDGTIDFKKLEDGLSLLEDALLDFRVRRGALALELKGIKKTLLAWPLDAGELAVAERDNRVRLRTLAKPDLPLKSDNADDPPASNGKDKSVGLSRLDVTPLEVDLALAGGGTFELGQTLALRLGSREHAALERLTVSGSLAYAPAARTSPTELRIAVQGLETGVDKLQLAQGRLRIGKLGLDAAPDVQLTMQGLAPQHVRGSLRGLTLESLEWRNSKNLRA